MISSVNWWMERLAGKLGLSEALLTVKVFVVGYRMGTTVYGG